MKYIFNWQEIHVVTEVPRKYFIHELLATKSTKNLAIVLVGHKQYLRALGSVTYDMRLTKLSELKPTSVSE